MEPEEVVKKKSKLPVVIAAVVAVVIVAGVILGVAIFSQSARTEKRIKDSLELAQHYMDELDYEQAIASYKAVLEIDPKNVEAYHGIADAYVGLERYEDAIAIMSEGYNQTTDESLFEARADVYIEYAQKLADAGDLDKALEILQAGYEATGDDRISAQITNLEAMQEEQMLQAAEDAEAAQEENSEKDENESEGDAPNDTDGASGADSDAEAEVSENEADTLSEDEAENVTYNTISTEETGHSGIDGNVLATFTGNTVLKIVDGKEFVDEKSTFSVDGINGAAPDYFYVIGIRTDCGMFGYDETNGGYAGNTENPGYMHLSAGFLTNPDWISRMGITGADQYFFYAEPYVAGKTYSLCPKGCADFLTKNQNSGKLKSFYWGVMWLNGDGEENGWGNGDATTYGWFNLDGTHKIYE